MPNMPTLIYAPLEKTLTAGDKVERFYCGHDLTDDALTLLDFRDGKLTLQEAYNDLMVSREALIRRITGDA